jgi:putative restriction endonuclease
MRYWVANTDLDWFSYLASVEPDDVNFWQPNAVRPITLERGAPWLFKLHNRQGGWIVGGGYFAHYTTMTPRFAWDAFGRANGAPDFDRYVRDVRRHSERALDPDASQVGATILVQPFFLPQERWIAPPRDWSSNLTRGKSYDTEVGEGLRLWSEVRAALLASDASTPLAAAEGSPAPYGPPSLSLPRLGQGAFRVMVTDAYGRRCAVTGERTLPVLEAAHIKPFRLVLKHELANGLLLRSDLHTLFDRGYITVTPESRLRVSGRIREEFENGRDYYALDGVEVRSPLPQFPRPAREALEWHSDVVFRG